MSNSELESKVINILENGYLTTPTKNKNLITLAIIAALFVVTLAVTYSLVFQQLTTVNNNHFKIMQEYATLEAKIIYDYEIENNIFSTRRGIRAENP